MWVDGETEAKRTCRGYLEAALSGELGALHKPQQYLGPPAQAGVLSAHTQGAVEPWAEALKEGRPSCPKPDPQFSFTPRS